MAMGSSKTSAPTPAATKTVSPASGPYATEESASEASVGSALKIGSRSPSMAEVGSRGPSTTRLTRYWNLASPPCGTSARDVATSIPWRLRRKSSKRWTDTYRLPGNRPCRAIRFSRSLLGGGGPAGRSAPGSSGFESGPLSLTSVAALSPGIHKALGSAETATASGFLASRRAQSGPGVVLTSAASRTSDPAREHSGPLT